MAERKRKKRKNLVIVESAAKARTIERYLGNNFDVKASVGHVRDLPKRDLGVEIEKDFTPKYVTTADRRKVVSDLRRAADQAEGVYLATDPDREGEAIAWHLSQILNINQHDARRVVFHEITPDAIAEAFSDPRYIDNQLVEAQQARRILDRLVGFKLSPFIRNKVAGGQSAGRVQSVALRLIVDREREIEAFVPEEYWELSVDLRKDRSAEKVFARLHRLHAEKKTPKIPNGDVAAEIVKELDSAEYQVTKVTAKKRKEKPRPPFITSTLQQQAARSLRFNSQRTMRVAQSLYEGVPLGDGEPVGLITYMRTDSTNLSDSALQEASRYITQSFGDRYSQGPRRYRTRSRNAQEAHEAIRPTSIFNTPEKIGRYLTDEQRRLYGLIWQRMVASQMSDALVERTTADINANAANGKTHIVRATGSVILFDGFRKLYIEERDEDAESEDSRKLPPLNEGELLALLKVNSQQKFTQPPPRYTEANLIRTLEELGIGRPSTYASIVSTIVDRNYVERDRNRFKPTKTGIAVCDMLKQYFTDIMDVSFTAGMETKLDDIATGELERVPMLKEFYGPFDATLQYAFENAKRTARASLDEPSGIKCDGGAELVVRLRKRGGSFLACPQYPTCKVAMDLHPGENASGEKIEEWEGLKANRMRQCHLAHPEGVPEPEKPALKGSGVMCEGGLELVIRDSRRGEFLACTQFPKCRVALDLKPDEQEKLQEWNEKREQRMKQCYKAHPEAAKRNSTKSRRGTRRATASRRR